MARKKTLPEEQKPGLVGIPTPTLEQEAEAEELSAAAIEQLSPYQVKKLKQISYAISKIGLSVQDACVVVNLDPRTLEDWRKDHAIIGFIIDRKRLELKKNLLSILTAQAIKGDKALAQLLLERLFPEDFAKNKTPDSMNDDIIAQGIEFIQKHGDSSPLVTETSGRAFVVRHGSKTELPKLDDILK